MRYCGNANAPMAAPNQNSAKTSRSIKRARGENQTMNIEKIFAKALSKKDNAPECSACTFGGILYQSSYCGVNNLQGSRSYIMTCQISSLESFLPHAGIPFAGMPFATAS